jgi:hypothetical protein
MAPLFLPTSINYLFGIPLSVLKIVAAPLFVGTVKGYTFKLLYQINRYGKEKVGHVAALQMFQRWWREMALVM